MKKDFEIDVKVDRVTISGDFELDSMALKDKINANSENWLYVSEQEYKLVRVLENGVFEHVAGLYKNPYRNSWRLDTSNHLEGEELNEIKSVIGLMKDAHFTRLDIAFTWCNSPYRNMAHRIYRFGASQSFFRSEDLVITGRAQQVETIYSGRRKSEQMIRYYDKLAEMRSRRKQLPEGVEQLERLEIQLRGSKTAEWISSCEKMLECFKLPKFGNVDNPQDRAMLLALENKIVSWNELAKATAAKFRKLIKENDGLDNSLSKLLLEKLEEKKNDISLEIIDFLNIVGIEK